MELHQLRCFVAAAEELHFGRAAQRLEMLPSALGRYIRLLEDDLGTRLMTRTTRSVTLTDDGVVLLKEARALLAQADNLAVKFHGAGPQAGRDHPRRRDRQRSGGAAADAAFGFSRTEAGRHGEIDGRQDDPAVAARCSPAGSTWPWCALPRNPTSGSNFCFSCTRRPSSRCRTVIPSRRENG